MDPVTLGAVLAAIVGGAGEALGSRLWAELSALVRRPFERVHAAEQSVASLPGGSAELAALEQSPADQARALALAEVLVERADADVVFRQALEAWWEQASQIRIGVDVTNTVRGGIFNGPVLQGRDFTGLTFGSPALLPPTSPEPDPDA